MHRVAREGVANGGPPRLGFEEQAGREELGEPVLVALVFHEIEVEDGARHGRVADRAASDNATICTAPRRARSWAVARPVEGEVGAGGNCPASGRSLAAPQRAPRRRTACRQCGRAACRRAAATARTEHLLDETRGFRRGQRLERQLSQHAVAAEVVAEAAQRVRAEELVGAVGRDDEQRHVAERRGERGEELWPRRTTADRRATRQGARSRGDDGRSMGRPVESARRARARRQPAVRRVDRADAAAVGGVAVEGRSCMALRRASSAAGSMSARIRRSMSDSGFA